MTLKNIEHRDNLPRRGMPVNVFSNAATRGCTRGPSATHDMILVVGDGVPQLVEVRDDVPTFALTHRGGSLPPKLVPIDCLPGAGRLSGMWTMMGGSYAGSSDSRWRELVERSIGGATQAASMIAIHDRVEGSGGVVERTTGVLS